MEDDPYTKLMQKYAREHPPSDRTAAKSTVYVTAEVESEALIGSLVSDNTHDSLIGFVLELDERVCDLAFTEELFARLGSIILTERAVDAESDRG